MICESRVNLYIGIFMSVYISGVCDEPVNQAVCGLVFPFMSLPFQKGPSAPLLVLPSHCGYSGPSSRASCPEALRSPLSPLLPAAQFVGGTGSKA